jgi:hypothetical protein
MAPKENLTNPDAVANSLRIFCLRQTPHLGAAILTAHQKPCLWCNGRVSRKDQMRQFCWIDGPGTTTGTEAANGLA